MLNTLMRSALLLLLATAVTACGFHLRGNIPLSEGVKNMFVVAPSGSFKGTLEDVLTKAGADLASAQGGADVILSVTRAEPNRTVGTLDSLGKANSYNLNFKVRYSLDAQDGTKIRKVTNLKATRQYNFDPERVVESEAEEAELLESMEEEIALQIVRQLSSITDFEPK
jgi:LPS-assembly lipoprotein